MHTIQAIPGKTYLLRIINAALNTEHFFTLANHKKTVVEVDATYTKPFVTDHLVITQGQTTNVLLTAYQPVGSYYMSMGPYISASSIPYQQERAATPYHKSCLLAVWVCRG